MLILKPNCECCDKNLPPASADARICSFECTFCSDCASERFDNTCPNCGGNFVPRPVRPEGKLANNPASMKRFTKAHAACAQLLA
ncbi:MAG: DUF1272 domain-containing protein [Pseudomonadota bacterium]